MKRLNLVVLLCAVGVALGAVAAANAAQLAGGGIGAVLAPQATAAPALRVAERSLPPDTLPVNAPLAVAQPRPWGGLKLDLNPYLKPARRSAGR